VDKRLTQVVVFLGGCLLFQVQPMIAKAVLPWFGGTAAVWTTCLLFFQVALFLGYAYAHLLVRVLSPRWQGIAHGILLLASLASLPVGLSQTWKPKGGEDPIPLILLQLSSSVGLPYFLLSATTPLAQTWSARLIKGGLPFRFYALSNFASLLALVGYPTLIEPHLDLSAQMSCWSVGYVTYIVCCTALAVRGMRPAPPGCTERATVQASPRWQQSFSWLLLAAAGAVLSISVTNHLTQNIAPIPFLWVLPLATYLLTFVLCFDRDRGFSRGLSLWLHGLALCAAGALLVWGRAQHLLSIVALPVILFCSCMFLHGELVRRKPGTSFLTHFYLMISLGGALGAALVGLGAPYLLRACYELPIAIAGCAVLTLFLIYKQSWKTDLAWLAISTATVGVAMAYAQTSTSDVRQSIRNFYGGLRVLDVDGSRVLVHGAVVHGSQILDPRRRMQAASYYAPGTGIQLAIDTLHRAGFRAGVIGLGAGTLAAYGQEGDTYRFYEINPAVIRLANSEFTYLKDSKARVEVVAGDGRLALEKDEGQLFDLLVVDAFSGDSIPVHLLTREAFGLYFHHLRPGGAIAIHISNDSLNLAPVVERLAAAVSKSAVRVWSGADTTLRRSEADWVIVGTGSLIDRPLLAARASRLQPRHELTVWTDDYSSIFPILR
jgi:hypothetical protein